MKPLVLASASETRARLLRAAGVEFDVVPANIDEDKVKTQGVRAGHATAELAVALAELKSLRLNSSVQHVLGADQILDLDGRAVGKCATLADAASLLGRLRGRAHELVTAVALAQGGKVVWRHVERSRLVMRNFTDAFVAEYLSRAGESVLQAVGCYELEGLGSQLFERVEGDFFSVLGLPLLPTLEALRKRGLVAT